MHHTVNPNGTINSLREGRACNARRLRPLSRLVGLLPLCSLPYRSVSSRVVSCVSRLLKLFDSLSRSFSMFIGSLVGPSLVSLSVYVKFGLFWSKMPAGFELSVTVNAFSPLYDLSKRIIGSNANFSCLQVLSATGSRR